MRIGSGVNVQGGSFALAVMKDFLTECQSADYDGRERYTAYTGLVNETMRDLYGRNIPDLEEMPLEEQNMEVTGEAIFRYQKEKVMEETGVSYHALGESQEKQAERVTAVFLNQLKRDMERGE